MKTDLKDLLAKAKQFETEQKEKTDSDPANNTEYNIGMLMGIKRIIMLIERYLW